MLYDMNKDNISFIFIVIVEKFGDRLLNGKMIDSELKKNNCNNNNNIRIDEEQKKKKTDVMTFTSMCVLERKILL